MLLSVCCVCVCVCVCVYVCVCMSMLLSVCSALCGQVRTRAAGQEEGGKGNVVLVGGKELGRSQAEDIACRLLRVSEGL